MADNEVTWISDSDHPIRIDLTEEWIKAYLARIVESGDAGEYPDEYRVIHEMLEAGEPLGDDQKKWLADDISSMIGEYIGEGIYNLVESL